MPQATLSAFPGVNISRLFKTLSRRWSITPTARGELHLFDSGGRQTMRTNGTRLQALASFLLLTCLLLSTVQSPRIAAQEIYGVIQGFVRDASGDPLEGATVIVSSQEKGSRVTATTNSSGHYDITHLAPDTYDLRIEGGGKTALVPDISVFAGQEQVANVNLPKSSQTTTLAGRAGGSTLRTRSDVSTDLARFSLADLPNFNRNFTRFELLAPGTEQNPQPNPSENPQGGLQISINGQFPNGTAFQLDGTDNREPVSAVVVINPTVESVAEAKITTQSFDAESGQALSGIVTVHTRSGSNSFHGNVFELRHSNWGQAHNPDLNNPSLVDLPSEKFNLFGASAGGPIIRNKLFIFGDYQGTRRVFDSAKAVNVPTLKVRQTCFDPSSTVCDLSEYQTEIFDPLTRDPNNPKKGAKPFPADPSNPDCLVGLCIPTQRIPEQAIKLMSLLPAPTSPGVVQNYLASDTDNYNDDGFNVRVDQIVGEKMKTFGRYSFADFRVDSPGAFGTAGGVGFIFDGFAGQTLSRNQGVSAGFDYSLSSRLLTDFRFGFLRHSVAITPNSYGTPPAEDAGIPNLNLGDLLTSGMPQIQVIQPRLGPTGNKDIQFGEGPDTSNCDCPLFVHLQQFQFVNNWAYNRGNHLLKAGADVRYIRDQRLSSDIHRAGQLTFNIKDTQGSGGIGGLGLATFLLGDVTAFSRFVGAIDDAGERQKRAFFYAQDTWHATSRLTLSYGLRWEIYFPVSVTGRNQGGWLDLATGMINVAGSSCCNLQGNVQNTWRNLAPRVGIAYQIEPKTILRAAYGRNFDAASQQIFGTAATENPPVLLTQSVRPLGTGASSIFPLAQGPPDPPAILFPNVPASGQIPLPPNVSASAVPSRLLLPTLDSWNFTVQQELSPNAYFEVGYVGNKGTHVTPGGSYNVNEPTIANYAADECFRPAQPAVCQTRYPFFNRYGWTQSIAYFGDDASENYNSLQAKFSKRFNRGYQLQMSYVWGKGLGYDSDYFVHDPRLNYGPDDFDRTHRFILFNVFDLPVGKGRMLLGNSGTFLNYFVGNWSLSTVTNWSSGLPFSPSYISSECTTDRDTGPCRPNMVGDVHITGQRSEYFTTTGGVALPEGPTDGSAPGDPVGPWQRPAVGAFGDTRRNSLRGPGFLNTDLVVLKNLTVTERYSVQFRMEFANVFNRVNLNNPNACVDCLDVNGAPTAGVISNLARGASQRQVEFALKLQF